jgi:hypothetical protein
MRNVFGEILNFHPSKLLPSLLLLGLLGAVLAGCSITQAATPSPLPKAASPSFTPSPTSLPTSTPTTTASHAPTATRTSSSTPTITNTPTVTPTPTEQIPQGVVLMQAFCRYGPGKAYLYSHGLYEKDHVLIDGRSPSARWLWVKPDNLERHCWAAASVMEVTGDVRSVPVVTTQLPHSTLYSPPEKVDAYRQGDQVTVAWSRVWMTQDDDRGYLIEATVCQNGGLVSLAVQTNDTSYTFTDEDACGGASGGRLYTVEKHGYTDPVEIPWP